MTRHSQFPGIALVDTCLGLVVMYMLISMLSVMSINVESQKNIQSDGLFVILVEWPGTSNDDVDTYVEDPAKHLVMFKRLQDGLMNLERDCTGASNNEITAPDGTKVRSVINEERVDIRGILPGEYCVNIHLYRHSDPDPVPVSVTLYKMSNVLENKHEAHLVLKSGGEELTAFRFTLDKNGNVSDINQLKKTFTNHR